MSIVKLDLRIQSQSPQQQYFQQQQQQLSPSAPLVKINLSPESTRLSENGSCSSSLCSCCPTSNNHSMQAANLIANIRSASSISTRISPQHMCTASNKHLQQQQQHDDQLSNSPTYPYSQAQHHHHSMNIDEDVLSSLRNKLNKAPRKGSSTISGEQINTQNQTTLGNTNANSNLENIVDSLSKKLEKSSLENNELRETLIKEKSRSQMMLSENLSIKEELKKAYLRLKELESLQNMRSSQQSQAIHSQRSSWVRSSPVKKPLGYNPPQKSSQGLRRPSTSTHQQNNQKQLQQQQQQQQFDLSLNNNHNNNNLLHNDEDIFRDQHEGCSMQEDCYSQQQLLEQNQSSLSILDILQNLNGKRDLENECKDSNNFHEDHGNGSFSGTISKLKTQNSNGLKMTAVTSQSRRRTNGTTPLQQQQGGYGSCGMMKKPFS